jgi:NAD(P)-dependent dehydrogenase (short-subunit alcohol dehydrogenase family)
MGFIKPALAARAQILARLLRVERIITYRRLAKRFDSVSILVHGAMISRPRNMRQRARQFSRMMEGFMDLELSGKVAVITGASKGLGRATADVLAGEGMHVVLAARNATGLDEVAGGITTRGGKAMCFAGDLSDPTAAGELINATLRRFGRIDLLVNNAGATKRGDFLQLTDQDWLDGYALKFHGAVRLCRAAWPHLMKTRGSIINIAGVAGRTGSAEFTLGGSVNAALSLFTKALADRGVHDGVRVNAINPGAFATGRLALRIQKVATDEGLSDEAAAARLASHERIARFGIPKEIGEAIAFLASPRAAYIHGAVIDIDGGVTRAL